MAYVKNFSKRFPSTGQPGMGVCGTFHGWNILIIEAIVIIIVVERFL